MTIQELKNLKVGDVVKYTHNASPFYVEYHRVLESTPTYIQCELLSKLTWFTIHFGQNNINEIASMLSIGKPEQAQTDRQLRLVEAKIKDAEFDVRTIMRETEFMYKIHGVMSSLMQEEIAKKHEVLTILREQRNKLIEQI
jgi:hypothetical protein